MAENFEPVALTAMRAVALKHSNYCMQCYSHVTTTNYSSAHADTHPRTTPAAYL